MQVLKHKQLLSEAEIKAIRLLLGDEIKYIAWDPNGNCYGYTAKPFKDGWGYYSNEDVDPDMMFWDLAQFSFANRAKGQCISIHE